MEEQQLQSVNTGEVAETQQPQGTSVPSEVADPKPVQDAETNAHYAEQRRKQELDEYRGKVETYEQNLNRVAKLAGYQSHEDMLQQLDAIEKQQQEQEYRNAGLDPNVLNKYLEQHPDIQYAREMKAKQEEDAKFREEANELFQEFPDLKADQIPQEVWQLKENKGLSLLDAYLRVNYKSLGQQKEQEALQKLQNNAQSSTGSLGGGDVQHNTSIKNMSKADFEAYVRKVKNGEVRDI